MSEIVEAVSRAIKDALHSQDIYTYEDGEHFKVDGFIDVGQVARAAIAAIRDSLTGDLASVFIETCHPFGPNSWAENPSEDTYMPNEKGVPEEWFGDYEDFEKSWRNLFDAMLKEPMK